MTEDPRITEPWHREGMATKMGRETEAWAEYREDFIERKLFYDAVRESLFSGNLSQTQVDGMNADLNYWERRTAMQPRPLQHLAYILATEYHETAFTMQPIEEYGKGAGHDYAIPDPTTGESYHGRGKCQLTWSVNYQHAGDQIHVDLYWQPELALQMQIAIRVMMRGMEEGWFTGKRLKDYINKEGCDYVGARKIINGTDKAEQIAGYAEKFEAALVAATSTVVSDHPEFEEGE